MAILRPFCPLRPLPELAQTVASAPYDVVTTAEARALAAGNENSFLRVIRSEIEFDEGANPYDEAVYQRAAANLAKLVGRGVLVRDPEAGLFVYRIATEEHVQTGIFGTVSLDEYDSDLIKKHERTRPDKEDDRTRHMLALGVQPGPVLLAYRAKRKLDSQYEHETGGAPLYEVTTETGVRHQIWRVADADAWCEAFKTVPCLYVADGHHRIASAARARAALRAKNPRHDGTEPYNFVLAALFPSESLRILAYNRVVHKLPMEHEAFLEELHLGFDVVHDAGPTPVRKHHIHMYLGGTWYALLPKPGETPPDDPVEALDVRTLHRKVLLPLLGIEDERTDKNIDFVGGGRGSQELERIVDAGEAECAFALYATAIDDLLDVADNGQIMPPKSTWFEPKLRSGLLIHPIAE